MEIFKNILVPIDFSIGSESAFNYAIKISVMFNSTIHLLHVIEPIILPATPGFPAINPADLTTNLQNHYSDELDKLSQRIPEKINRLTKVLLGKAGDIITYYAEKNSIDLICIATHGRKGFEHLIFGSTTEKVLRKAKCPVLALRITN